MPARKIGYARVSTKDQNLDRQIEILKAEGIDERDIYVEKESGKSFERPVYRTIVDHILREGDLLVVTELKRFGRNYVEIYEEWFKITKIVKAYIKVTSIPILNTAQSQELIGQVIADVVLALFAYIAQEDLEERHELQRQGIEAGKHLGRPSQKAIDIPDGFRRMIGTELADPQLDVFVFQIPKFGRFEKRKIILLVGFI